MIEFLINISNSRLDKPITFVCFIKEIRLNKNQFFARFKIYNKVPQLKRVMMIYIFVTWHNQQCQWLYLWKHYKKHQVMTKSFKKSS